MKRAIFTGLSIVFLAANVIAAESSDLDQSSDPCSTGTSADAGSDTSSTASKVDTKDLLGK